MRSVIHFAAAVPATTALIAALLVQASPASAHRICGATAVEASVQVQERRHAWRVARALWSNCARKYYGDEWSSLMMAKAKNEMLCYDVRAWRRYYRSDNIVRCDTEIRYPQLVCFLRATPCRYRSDDD
jgi:hypothetical protein